MTTVVYLIKTEYVIKEYTENCREILNRVLHLPQMILPFTRRELWDKDILFKVEDSKKLLPVVNMIPI